MRIEERQGGVWITLEEPPRNVLGLPTLRALDAALVPLASRRDLKTVVFRSGISGTFSAGADVKDHTRERAPAMLEAFHGFLRRLDTLPQVALAAVDGICLGAGFELVLACDVELVFLPRLVGKAAAELVFTGHPMTAQDAFRLGLVTRIVQDLDEEVLPSEDAEEGVRAFLEKRPPLWSDR